VDAAASSAITVRPVTFDDGEFLFCLYVAVRAPAFESVPPDRVAPLLRQQFTAHEASHRAVHPAATHHIVQLGHDPIGQCRIGPHPEPLSATVANEQPLLLVDLTLLPEHHALTETVVDSLHRHAEWFGARLWVDETVCTRPSS